MTKSTRMVRGRKGTRSNINERPAKVNKQVSRSICAALVVLAVLPYLQTLRYDFVNFDDGTYVAENGLVQHGLSWSSLAWAFTTMSAGNWPGIGPVGPGRGAACAAAIKAVMFTTGPIVPSNV